MKVVVLCQHGNNRSVTLAHQLKYLGHDVLSAGIETNSEATLAMLHDWADKVIYTDRDQVLGDYLPDKVEVWQIGPDIYPRPFNPDLLNKVRALIEQHRNELHG